MRRRIHPLVIAALAWLLLAVSGPAITETTPFEQSIQAFLGVLSLALIPEIFFAWRTHWTLKYGETPPWLFQIAIAIIVIWLESVAADNLLSFGRHVVGWPFVLGGLAPFAYPAVRLIEAARQLSTIEDAADQCIATRRLLADLICCGGLAVALSWAFLGHTDQTISDGLVGVPVGLFGLIAFVEGAGGFLSGRPVPPFHSLLGQMRVLGAALAGSVVVITAFLLAVSPANGLPHAFQVAAGLIAFAYAAARFGRRFIGRQGERKAPG